MKDRFYLLPLIALLLAAQACAFPRIPAMETPASVEIEVIPEINPEPTSTAQIIETETPPQEPTKAPFACGTAMVETTAFGVTFCYPGQYSSGYTQARVPENPPSDELPIWGVHPDMIELTLTNYPVDNRYHAPIVRIYPVVNLVALDPAFHSILDDLQSLLTSEDPNPTTIPFVPIFNAAQMMVAQVTYLDFRNGKGVRFITQYSQAALPISNDSAFYAFIGLTDDGAHLISATLPVTHPLFYEDGMTEPEEGWPTFTENFETYLSTTETELNMQAQDAFFPHLSPLDEMMASFLIPPDINP